jgi:hypothetical protein
MRMGRTGTITAVALALTLGGCMSYLTHDRGEALIYGVDIDQTLDVAEAELERGRWGSVLTLWCIRDQYFTPPQAARVAQLYREHIGGLTREFNVWHLTWAIANMYRHGDPEVEAELQDVYDDATRRASSLSRAADTHANGQRLHMGDAHVGGRYHAYRHVVVPGNPRYIQSVAEYRARAVKQGDGAQKPR